MNVGKSLTAMVLAAALAGCAAVAPSYNTSPDSTQSLQAARVQPAKVGAFTAEATADNESITLRASTMKPAQGTFAKYLADAVMNELDLVKLYSPSAATEISGVLIRNSMNTGLAMTGDGLIEARFVVRRDGMVKFDKIKSARIEWDTNYFGAIAIPRARQEYSRLVGKLLKELFSDPDFVAALK